MDKSNEKAPAKPFDWISLNQEWFSAKSQADFVGSSPHLKHPALRTWCYQLAGEVFHRVAQKKKTPRVLDMGAGDGMLTLPYLQMGAHVTAADATDELLCLLVKKAAPFKDSLTIISGDIFDALNRLRSAGQQFDIICASSFLHHIPDYLRLCQESAGLISAEGILFTLQDPLDYDTLGWRTFCMDRLSYFSWRLFQGNYIRGIKTRYRRLVGKYRDDLAEDTAEYHVVRNGIDQLAIKQMLESKGFVCELRPYWSTQSTVFQCLGEKLQLLNSFALIAEKK